MQIIQSIQNRIYEIRGERVILDRDLALLYETETKVLNLAVKRNIKRFPSDFMFRLNRNEYDAIKFRLDSFENKDTSLRFQFETLKPSRGQHSKYLPFAFTEQGIAMLSGILNSDKAILMNIAIMRAFVAVRKLVMQQNDLKLQIKEIRERLGDHDIQLNQIYDAMENLMDEKAAQRKWEERERIGFQR